MPIVKRARARSNSIGWSARGGASCGDSGSRRPTSASTPSAAILSAVRDAFGNRAALAMYRHHDGFDDARTAWSVEASKRYGFPIVASARPLFHEPSRKKLCDVLHAIRLGTTLGLCRYEADRQRGGLSALRSADVAAFSRLPGVGHGNRSARRSSLFRARRAELPIPVFARAWRKCGSKAGSSHSRRSLQLAIQMAFRRTWPIKSRRSSR